MWEKSGKNVDNTKQAKRITKNIIKKRLKIIKNLRQTNNVDNFVDNMWITQQKNTMKYHKNML